MSKPILPPPIEEQIIFIRGQKVLLDTALADLYGVETRIINRNVKRHLDRFPSDFMFQLSAEEAAGVSSSLKSQTGISRHGGRRHLPYAFTAQGVAMLSSVLNSKRAVLVNIEIMRAFVRLRQLLSANAELARKMDALERKYDSQFKTVFDAIRELMKPPEPGRRPIGFVTPRDV